MGKLMPGLTMSSLRKHPSLIPLFVIVGAGVCGSGLYLGRLALKNPDVVWDKSKGPYSQSTLPASYQYKFYSPFRDYSKLTDGERPSLKED